MIASRALERGRLALACAGALSLLSANPSAAGLFPVLDCDSFGSQCEAALVEGDEHESTISVPGGFCPAIGDVRVDLTLDHSWVGDLSVALRHEASQIEVVLVDRPGSPFPTSYGCPGENIDATFDDAAATLAEIACDPTIPAIDGAVRSGLYARTLIVEPTESTFEIDDCPFTRFSGEFEPNGGDADHGCAPFAAGDSTASPSCDFRGRWNDDCGNANLLVRLERFNDGRVRANVLGQAFPFHFDAAPNGPLDADLQVFGSIADREIKGILELRTPGLEAFRDLPCAGDWTLLIRDQAAPHHGRLRAWSLDLVAAATATATPSETPSATPSATPTASATHTPTTTPSSTVTEVGEATATPSTAVATATPTDTVPTAPTTASTAPVTETATPPVEATETPTAARATDTPTESANTATPTQSAVTETPTQVQNTETPTLPEATETATLAPPTDTPVVAPCIGDCNGDGSVNIGELIRGVNIALGNADLEQCRSLDADGNGSVSIGELIRAVRNALEGC